MKNCPCCSNQLLRQFSRHQLYWFCPSCRQEMPLLEQPSLSQILSTLEPNFARVGQLDRLLSQTLSQSLPQTAMYNLI